MSNRLANRVLLVGWDAADWNVIHPLLDAGKMPNLAGIVKEGVMGNLATLNPQVSPMLWTTIATGKHAFKHGILGFTEPNPNSGGVRPITSLSRKTKAIWNILSQNALKSNIIGWWPSHPAEPINGVMVSNLYQLMHGSIDRPWPMIPGSVHPERIITNLANLRCHTQQLDAGHVLPFVPRLAEIDQDADKRPEMIGDVIAETLTVQNAALAVMQHEPWDFTAVYFNGIDYLSHLFMRYCPPKMEAVTEEEFALYRHVVEGGYILHDIALGKLIDCAGPDTAIMVISDHGFRTKHQRPTHLPNDPNAPTQQHRPYGVLALKGPGIKRDELIYGASLLDICPTVLALFGLPQGQDMDGKVLLGCFKRATATDSIPSWDAIAGKSGEHPIESRLYPFEAQKALEKLIALGYVERPNENNERSVSESLREQEFNLARSYTNAGRGIQAIPILEELSAKWPDHYRFSIHLADAYLSIGRTRDARRVVESLIDRKKHNAAKSRKALAQFSAMQNSSDMGALNWLEMQQVTEWQREASLSAFAVEYLMGSLLHSEKRREDALKHFKQAEKIDEGNIKAHLKLGQIYYEMKMLSQAKRYFTKALTTDPESATAHLGLSKCFLRLQENDAAAEAALDAIGLLYFNPQAHYYLGVALHRLGKIDNAIEALEVAVSQSPSYVKAHYRLSNIYKWHLGDMGRSSRHRLLAEKARGEIIGLQEHRELPRILRREAQLDKQSAYAHEEAIKGAAKPRAIPVTYDPKATIAIVTGLPRSGTSMTMQMLKLGGIQPYADGIRAADVHNPMGYYECEEAKRIHYDASWMGKAAGKAVKIIAQQIRFLPLKYDYRVVFMERDINEIVQSQAHVLGSERDREDHSLASFYLYQTASAKAFLDGANIPTVYMSYNGAIADPTSAARNINAFFAESLDENAMRNAINPGLYRQQVSTGPPSRCEVRA